MMVPKPSGFTLLELCLAIAIGVIIFSVAMPSLAGLFAQQRLQHTYEAFDALAGEARQLSMSKHTPYALVFGKTDIALIPEDAGKEVARLAITDREKFGLELPAALIPNPPKKWVFWPTGTCEPATVTYAGDAGSWTARYDPLTVRGTLFLNEKP